MELGAKSANNFDNPRIPISKTVLQQKLVFKTDTFDLIINLTSW